MPELAQIEGDGKLEGIEGSKAFRHAVLSQEFPCAVKVTLVDRRSDKETPACKISAEATPGDLQRLLIDFPGPGLDRKYGLQLHNREVRDQGPRPRLFEYAVHVFGTAFLVVPLGQRAGVEEVVWQSALLPKSDHGVGKGAGDCGQRSPHFIEADVIMRCFGPFLGREVSGDVLAHSGRIGDGHGHLLSLLERDGLEWMENTIFVLGLNSPLHTPSA